MARRHDDGVRPDRSVAADRESAVAIEHAMRSHVHAFLEVDRAAIAGEDDSIRERHAARDHDPSAEEVAVGLQLQHRGLGDGG